MRKRIVCATLICALFNLVTLLMGDSIAQEKSDLPVQGPTVTISGKITFPGYKEGQRIFIGAKSSSSEGPPDIAHAIIAQPGDYSLKVPQNIGNAYIRVAVLQPGEMIISSKSLRQKYDEGRPIEVGAFDISGLDIAIQ
ncbi:MAG: hypothetical protein Q7S42_05635 [Candidatus Omnitrophota bacterium]|nr:hypothetical protein [Candidatus Omnitrophota bacterium]